MTAALRLADSPPPPAGPKSEPWMEHAACVGKPVELFFEYRTDRDIEQARTVCQSCPVRRACLNHALANRIEDGMWGGYTEPERRRIRRNRPPIVKKGRPPATVAPRVTTGDRILELLRERPMTAVELQDRLGYKQNTIAHWTGVLRRDGSITWSFKPGTRQWLYQICGGEPSP